VIDVKRYGYHMIPTSVVLTFDEALTAITADDPRNYWIIGPAGRRIEIKSAVYNPTTDTVTLRPRERINLHHRYELVVDGTSAGAVANTFAQKLGSNSDGRGSDYKGSLTWRNVVFDPPWPRIFHRHQPTNDVRLATHRKRS
jgi:hypothetical protein